MKNTAALINELFLLAVVIAPVWSYLDFARHSYSIISLVIAYVCMYICMYMYTTYVLVEMGELIEEEYLVLVNGLQNEEGCISGDSAVGKKEEEMGSKEGE